MECLPPGRHTRLPGESHPSLDRGPVCLAVVAASTCRHGVLPAVGATTRLREQVINGVCRTFTVGTAMMIAAQHATLGPSGCSSVQESGFDVADEAQDQRPGIWADAVSVAGFLNNRNLTHQHPNRVLDRDGVQSRVVGVE